MPLALDCTTAFARLTNQNTASNGLAHKLTSFCAVWVTLFRLTDNGSGMIGTAAAHVPYAGTLTAVNTVFFPRFPTTFRPTLKAGVARVFSPRLCNENRHATRRARMKIADFGFT